MHCPLCNNDTFIVSVNIPQEWLIDSNDNLLAVTDDYGLSTKDIASQATKRCDKCGTLIEPRLKVAG